MCACSCPCFGAFLPDPGSKQSDPPKSPATTIMAVVTMVPFAVVSLLAVGASHLPPAAPPPPSVCDPTAKPPQYCPDGKPCPNCGQVQCTCPGPKPPALKYSCNSETHQCAISAAGNFTNLTACNTACAPALRFACTRYNGTADKHTGGQCVEGRAGSYTSLTQCEAKCSLPCCSHCK